MSPMPLLTLRIISSTWRSKTSLSSNNKPKCLSFAASCCQIIKINGWCIHRVNLKGKVNLHSLLKRIWIELHLPLIHPLSNTSKVSVRFCQAFIWVTDKRKREVSSANIFTLHFRLAGMSLIKIRNNRAPKIEPWRTPAGSFRHSDA